MYRVAEGPPYLKGDSLTGSRYVHVSWGNKTMELWRRGNPYCGETERTERGKGCDSAASSKQKRKTSLHHGLKNKKYWGSQLFFANSLWSWNSEVLEVCNFLQRGTVVGSPDAEGAGPGVHIVVYQSQGCTRENCPLPGVLWEEGLLPPQRQKTLQVPKTSAEWRGSTPEHGTRTSLCQML